MAKKVLKNTPKNLREMARPGEQPVFGQCDTPQKKLKAWWGCVFEIFPESKALLAVSTEKTFILKFCVKRPFKGSLKGGLKKIIKRGQRSLTYFLNFTQNGRFYHGQMV